MLSTFGKNSIKTLLTHGAYKKTILYGRIILYGKENYMEKKRKNRKENREKKIRKCLENKEMS